MKQLRFDTKENNKKRQEQEFLALSPSERVELFLKDCSSYSIFPSTGSPEKKDNFVIKKKKL